jgi:hypothetical protein
MFRPIMLAPILRSLALVLLGGLLTWAALSRKDAPLRGDDDDTPPASLAAQAEPGDAGTLILTAGQQRQAGIVATVLVPSRRAPELGAAALVVDLQPLLDLRERGRSLQAEREAARAEASASRQALERLSSLRRQDAASSRQWQEANARAALGQSQLAAAESRWRALGSEARQQWGETLSRWALEPTDSGLEGLAGGRDRLLLVTLPPEGLAGAPPVRIFAGRGERARAREARLVSAAPRSDSLLQGETYFYALPAEGLRTAMRLDAWLPRSGEAESGVDVPREAIVWRAGQPWLYVRTGPEGFERRALAAYRDLGGVWFVTAGVRAGEAVVTGGAQLLLSEEFRRQIPDEDDD